MWSRGHQRARYAGVSAGHILFHGEPGFEGLFHLGVEGLEFGGIDEGVGITGEQAFAFFLETEVAVVVGSECCRSR